MRSKWITTFTEKCADATRRKKGENGCFSLLTFNRIMESLIVQKEKLTKVPFYDVHVFYLLYHAAMIRKTIKLWTEIVTKQNDGGMKIHWVKIKLFSTTLKTEILLNRRGDVIREYCAMKYERGCFDPPPLLSTLSSSRRLRFVQ